MGCLCAIRVFLIITFIQCYTGFNCEAGPLIACPKRNMYIKVLKDGTEICKPCPLCGAGTQKTHCSLWHGTQCEPCPSDSFNDDYANKCKPCKKCQPGEYVAEKCTPTRDTVCVPCLKGTYSAVEDSARCSLCTRCKRHEELLGNCLRNRNTMCGGCIEGYFRESATESCWPCAKCHNDTFVVTECYLKSRGFSEKVCMPTYGMRGTKKREDKLENEISKENTALGGDMVFAGFLVTAGFSVICIFSVILFIQTSRRTQRCLGESRAVRKNATEGREKKARTDTSYHEGETIGKMYGRFKKSWKSLLNFFNQKKQCNSKQDVPSQDQSIRNSVTTDSRLNISDFTEHFQSIILNTGDIADDEKVSAKQESKEIGKSKTFESAKDLRTSAGTDTDKNCQIYESFLTWSNKEHDLVLKRIDATLTDNARDDVGCNEINTAYSELYINKNHRSESDNGDVLTDQGGESAALRPKKKQPRRKQRFMLKDPSTCIHGEHKHVPLYHTV